MYTTSRTAQADKIRDGQVSEIERERIRRIALNLERLQQCNVLDAARDLAVSTAPR